MKGYLLNGFLDHDHQLMMFSQFVDLLILCMHVWIQLKLFAEFCTNVGITNDGCSCDH